MRNAAILMLLFALTAPLHAADRELTLAREMLDDVVIRNDVAGMELTRDRLLRIAGDSEDRIVLRDAHYLVALLALFQSFSGEIDLTTGSRIVADAVRHADKAVEIDPQFADGWMIAAMLRLSAQRYNVQVAKDAPGSPSRFQRALDLDAASPGVALFNGMMHSFNPAGAAPAEGVKLIDDLVTRLDNERASTGRRFGLWDAQAHVWQIFVHRATDEPRAEVLRPMAARLMQLRPDFALGQQVADAVAERHFVAAPSVAWTPFLTDASGDGKNPKLPDVVTVDRAQDGERMWYRITLRDPLPRSFGVNLVVNRSGDPSTGMRWWGGGSTFKFDRLLTAWISRDGDRYFGTVGVTDDLGARGSRLSKIPADIQIAIGGDDRSVIIGVPRSALGLTDNSAMVVAVGSHLVWNDDATTAANSR